MRRAPRHSDPGGRAAHGHELQLREPRPDRSDRRLRLQVIANPAATAPNASSKELIRVPVRSGLSPRKSASDQNARASGSAPST